MKFSTSASGIMGSLGEPNSSLPWCDRIMCRTNVFSLRRETGQAVDSLVRQRHAHLDVTEQNPFHGVFKANLPRQFAHLADVVQDDARQQQVAMQNGIVWSDPVGQRKQAHNVLKQPAEPGVMQLLGGGRLAVGLRQAGSASRVLSRSFRFGSVKLSTKPRSFCQSSSTSQVVQGSRSLLSTSPIAALRSWSIFSLQPVVEARGGATDLHQIAALEFLCNARIVRDPRCGLPPGLFYRRG